MQHLAGALPLAQAVAAGALDSCENALMNIAGWLPLPGATRRREELDRCMSGKVCVVTGANAGIGYATAKKLAERGAHVVLACRSEQRGRQAAKELSAVEPLPGCGAGRVEFLQLDLGELRSVRSFARRFNARGGNLDLLVCNAGIMSPETRLVSQDGLELQFQVNFLSHWLLAHELLAEQRRRRAKQHRKAPRGREAAAAAGCCDGASGGAAGACACACGSGGTRLVMLSSLTHHAGSLNWQDKQSCGSYSPFTSYALSKLCNTIMAAEFQRRFDRHRGCAYGHDSAVSIHPGIVHTHLATGFFNQTGRSALPWLASAIQPVLSSIYPLVLRTPSSSADSMLQAATAPAARVAGRYMHNDRLSRPSRFADDPERGRELWDLAVELTGVRTDSSLA